MLKQFFIMFKLTQSMHKNKAIKIIFQYVKICKDGCKKNYKDELVVFF
jgi:hypothetical protein